MKTERYLRFAAFALAACATVACTTDDTNPEPGTPGNPDKTAPFTLTATIDDGDLTRVSMEDDGVTRIDLTWKEGDKIYVRSDNASNYDLYTFTAGRISADNKTATFSCPDFPVGETPAHAIHQGATTVGSYSFSPDYAFVTDVNGLVYCRDAVSLADHLPLFARYDGTRMTFRPFAAILKIKATLPAGVSGQPEGFSIAARKDPAAFYTSYHNLTTGSAVRVETGLRHVVVFEPAEALSLPADNTLTLYVALAPGEETAQPLDFDLKVGRHVCSAIVNGAGLEAGKCYPLTLPAAKWTVGTIYESGTGSDTDPFLIRSEEHLRSLARAVRTGETYWGKFFKLDADIAVADIADPWLPIGGWTVFAGNLDGGNHTVSGTFRLSDTHGTNLGFFGSNDTGVISNLTVEGDIIYESSRASSSTYRIGGIAGESHTTYTGCRHIGSLTVDNPGLSGMVHVAGIAGYVPYTMSGCTQSGGTITVNAPQARVYAGGICSSTSEYSYYTIHTCRNESDLTINCKDGYCGTLVGYNSYNCTVYDCSTVPATVKLTVNGAEVTPAPLIGGGNTTIKPCNEGH